MMKSISSIVIIIINCNNKISSCSPASARCNEDGKKKEKEKQKRFSAVIRRHNISFQEQAVSGCRPDKSTCTGASQRTRSDLDKTMHSIDKTTCSVPTTPLPTKRKPLPRHFDSWRVSEFAPRIESRCELKAAVFPNLRHSDLH